jgi:uncharacterized protein (DUF3084 family)
MQGVLETLFSTFVYRGLGPALPALLMVAPAKKSARAQLKKIYVLNEMGDMTGEYVLDPDCPIDYNDFLKVLPDEGIGDREALFVGEYVFTAFQSGKAVFVLLSRGQLAAEDINWTALLLTAADAHLAAEAAGIATHTPEPPTADANAEKALADREARLDVREKELAKLEVQLKADGANLKGRSDELDRQKASLMALADYVAQMQGQVSKGVDRARQSLEMSEHLAASAAENHSLADSKSLADLRQQFEDERKALGVAKDELETKYREATEKAAALERQAAEAAAAARQERAETEAREAEAERLRAAIEARVQDLSQRFATMAKERLMTSHKPGEESTAPAAAALQEIESTKGELAKERKFLQRRAIEMLDREEKVRSREMALGEREATVTKREVELAGRETALGRTEGATPVAALPPAEVEEAKRDIEMRVKIIQQKALELLDREERLRKRAAELEALQARLSGSVPVR